MLLLVVVVALTVVVVVEKEEEEEGDFELAGEEITRWLNNCCPSPLRLEGRKQLNANTGRCKNSLAVNCREKFHQLGQSVDVSVTAKPG